MSAVTNKVLLATDGSTEAARATRMAVELSEKLGAELHLTYVEPVLGPNVWPESAVYDTSFQNELRVRAEKDARARLDDEVRKVKEMGGEIAETHARIGRPDAEIVSLAEEIGADLVVLGSRGLGSLRRVLMGSVSTSVVRHNHGSVLVVRGEGEGFPGRILLATDGSREARLAREVAAEISVATGAELHIIHVLDTRPYTPHLGPETWDGWEANLERARVNAHSFLERQAARIRERGGQVAGTYIALDNPSAEIVRLSEDSGASLIAVGSRGLGGVKRALMGSVSDSVVRHAHCSVLVVRNGGKEES